MFILNYDKNNKLINLKKFTPYFFSDDVMFVTAHHLCQLADWLANENFDPCRGNLD